MAPMHKSNHAAPIESTTKFFETNMASVPLRASRPKFAVEELVGTTCGSTPSGHGQFLPSWFIEYITRARKHES